ncbi:MAG: flagellar hook-length control protein FliK [Pseudomonadota bacterium]
MAIELTPLAPIAPARPADRAGAGNRADDDQDGSVGGFSSALDEARTATPDAAPDTPVGDAAATHTRRRKAAADQAAANAATGDTTGQASAAAAGAALTSLAATGTTAGAAAAAGTASRGTTVGKVATAAATGAKDAQAAAPDQTVAAPAPGKPGLAHAVAGAVAAVTAGTAAGAAQAAVPGAAQAAAAAKADATAATPVPVVPAAASEAVAPAPVIPAHQAAPALAQDVDGVPGYQSNFARMQQALAHAPAGGKGAAADATMAAAQDLGATVTNLNPGALAGKPVPSTVSLGENAPTRLAGALAELAAGPRVAEAAGAAAGRSSESGGQAARDGRGDSGTGAGSAAPLGFGATAALDSSGWNNGFTSAATAAAGDAAAGGAGRSAEDLLADRIGNWVHQKTQSAELTLDAFGGSPVDVRISMTGSEAHVAFQSGSAETRQLLGGAVDQLRDLLQSQGLVLSGMSVGGSDTPQGKGQAGGRGDGGGRGRSATPAVERTADVAAAGRPVLAASQRAVDVFI